jgi:hypothetical protein
LSQAAIRTDDLRRSLCGSIAPARNLILNENLIDNELAEGNFKRLEPLDFELDWKTTPNLKGTYAVYDNIEGLQVKNPDQPIIRLYSDIANRDARKLFIQCRQSAGPCSLIAAGTVRECVSNKEQVNEHHQGCLAVIDAWPAEAP